MRNFLILFVGIICNQRIHFISSLVVPYHEYKTPKSRQSTNNYNVYVHFHSYFRGPKNFAVIGYLVFINKTTPF